MSLLRKLFGKAKPEEAVVEVPPCPHTQLAPRWDSVEDMGKLDRATSYTCPACNTVFSPEDAAPYLEGRQE